MSTEVLDSSAWRRWPIKLTAIPIAAVMVWGVVEGLEIKPGRAVAAPAFRLFSPEEVLGIDKPPSAALEPKLQAALAAPSAKARQAPLSSYPFALKALMAQRQGRREEAERLMLRALRLEPRSSAIRTWVMNRSFVDGRLTDAVSHAAVLYEIDPSVTPLVSKLLATVSQWPEPRGLVVKKLAGTPYMLDVVRAAKDAGLHRRHTLQLLSARGNERVQGVEQERVKLLEQFIAEGDHAGAYAAWQSFLPPGSARAAGIYDGGFSGLPGPAPFNWTLTRNDHVQAEPVPSGLPAPAKALAVRKFSADPATAASQALLLAPGRYRLSYVARREGTGAGSPPFEWKMVCGSTNASLARLPLGASPGETWTRRAEVLDVPASCPMSILQLATARTETPTEAMVVVTGLSLDRLR